MASSASSFSKCALPATGISQEIPEVCTKPASHLAFTVPGNILNASLWSSSTCKVGFWGTDIPGILFCCSWTLSRIACCFSSRVERCLISSGCDLISLACWKCKYDKTETWAQWAISSSTILANKASFPWRACASVDSCYKEALHWVNSCCNSWALPTLCLMPSSMLLNERALARKGLGSNCSGFIVAYGRCIKNSPGTMSMLGKNIFQMNCVTNPDSVKCPQHDTKINDKCDERINHKLVQYKLKLVQLVPLTDCLKIHLQSCPLTQVQNTLN